MLSSLKLGRETVFAFGEERYDMNLSTLTWGGVARPCVNSGVTALGLTPLSAALEATSIAHVTGLPVVALKLQPISPEARKYPVILKIRVTGRSVWVLTGFSYHTFAHKPLPDKYRPGMTMGPYGVHWDREIPVEHGLKLIRTHISRCQYILSQGNQLQISFT